jgi:hypothetical protein
MKPYDLRVMRKFVKREPTARALFSEKKQSLQQEFQKTPPGKGNNRSRARAVEQRALDDTYRQITEDAGLGNLAGAYDAAYARYT